MFTTFSFGSGGFLIGLPGGPTNAVLVTNTLPYTSAWGGTLGQLGVGYLGVRFHQADGLHYGWIRVHLPSRDPVLAGTVLFGTAVVDWAYESQPDTPIQAGAMGDGNGALPLRIDLAPAQPEAAGSFILIGDVLRVELNLAGQFTVAALRGPAPARAHVRPIATLGMPLVSGANYSSFFRELVLSRSEVNQLLRGGLYFSVQDGALIGRIAP
jgi:hypothetical protein